MSITDELREWAEGDTLRAGMSLRTARDQALAIADRIDAEYEKSVDELRERYGDMWAKGYSVCHAELMEGHPVIAADLEKAGWVKLPVDADGEYIHVGDVMDELDARCPGTPTTFTVADMFYQGNDRWHLRAYPATYDPKTCRHHHTPTVEDVLCELLDKVDDDRAGQAEIIAEYAKRLRLAGDAE